MDEKTEYVLFTWAGLYKLLSELEMSVGAREAVPIDIIREKIDEHKVHYSAIQVFDVNFKSVVGSAPVASMPQNTGSTPVADSAASKGE